MTKQSSSAESARGTLSDPGTRGAANVGARVTGVEEIGERWGISPKTAANHNVDKQKLGAESAAADSHRAAVGLMEKDDQSREHLRSTSLSRGVLVHCDAAVRHQNAFSRPRRCKHAEAAGYGSVHIQYRAAASRITVLDRRVEFHQRTRAFMVPRVQGAAARHRIPPCASTRRRAKKTHDGWYEDEIVERHEGLSRAITLWNEDSPRLICGALSVPAIRRSTR